MNINKGLVLDGITLDSESGAWNDARNIILTNNKQSVQNEPGFERVGKIVSDFSRPEIVDTYVPFIIDGSLLGTIETPNSIITFYKKDNYLLIYRDMQFICKSQFIPCSVNTPIFGTYTYNYKNELIIIWANGILLESDEIRYLNIDTPQVEIDDEDRSIINVDLTLLNSNIPNIEYTPVNNMEGGMLKAGTYFIALSMNITNFDKTSYNQLSDPIYIINEYNGHGMGYIPDAITNNTIHVTAVFDSHIYTSCNIAILYFNGTTTIVKLLENILIKNVMGVNKIDAYINDIDLLPDININEVLIKQNPYIKTNVLTTIQNKLILGGNKLVDSFNNISQISANKIYFECDILGYQTSEYYSQSKQDKLLQQTFQEDEVYAFYAGYRYKKGGYISIVHIPGPDATNYKTSKLHPLESKNPNELYEDDFPELRGLPVRHHRMPSYKNIVRDLNKAVYYTETTNITSIVGNPAGANPILFNTNSYDWTKRKYNTTIIDGTTIGVFNGHRIICGNYTDKSLIVEGTITIIIPGITDDIGFFINVYNNMNSGIIPVTIATDIDITNNANLIERVYFTPTSTEIIEGVGMKYKFNMNYKKSINQSVVYILGMEYPGIISVTGDIKIGVQEQTVENIKKFTIRLLPKNVSIPIEMQNVCSGIDIFCAKRTMNNSRIIDQDVIHTRFINHCVPYGLTTETELYNENKTNTYFKGHAYSLLHQYPNLSFVKNIDIFGFEDILGDDVTGLYNGGQTEIELRNIIDPYTINLSEPLRYVKNNNATDNNIRGESAIRIRPSTDLRNILPELYKDTPERHTNMYTQRVFYFINYLTGNSNFYVNYRNQQLIKLGSTSNEAVIKGDIFYTFDYGIRTSRLETDLRALPTSDTDEVGVFRHLLVYSIKSHYNLASRFNGLINTQRIYPYVYQTGDICNLPTIYDNYIKRDTDDGFNVAYNKRCDYYTYINSHRDDSTEINKNIIAISNVQSTESKEFRWRYFDPTSYRSIPFNKGFIINIISDGTKLYIQTIYSLFIAKLKDVLNMIDGQTYLGSGDVFDREPEEITDDVFGSFGCQHRYAITLNQFGYFAVDAMKGRIFNISNEKRIISDINAKEYFKHNLNVDTIDNPYMGLGISLHTDDYNNRLLVMNSQGVDKWLSYDLQLGLWISKHDYGSRFINTNRNGLYHYTYKYVNGDQITMFKQSIDSNFGKYSDFKYDDNPLANINIYPLTNTWKQSYIDVLFTDKQLNKILQSIAWKTEIDKNGIKTYKETIDFIMAYTNTQCTGLIPIITPNMFFNTDTALLKNDIWYFNELFDNVLNDTLPILDWIKQPTNNVNKAAKSWYNTSKLISDGFIVRFGISYNIRPEKVVLHMVDIIATTDNR